LGLPYALTYSVARVPGRAVEIIREVRTALGIRLLVALLLTAALLGVLTIGKPGYVRVGALVAVVTVVPSILEQCGLGVLQGLRRFTSFNVLRVAPNAAFAAAAGGLLLVGQAQFIALTVAWGASRALFVPVTLQIARSQAERLHELNAPAPPTASWMLRFGRRSMFGATPLEAYRVDQAVVALFLPAVSLGLYVVALAFTNLPRFIAYAVGMVANPLVAASETQPQARRRMWQFAWAGIPLYLPVIAALWLAAPQLTDFFFGPRFADSVPLTRLLLVATALYCARTVLNDAARGAGYPLAGTVAELVSLCAAVPLFAVFVPAWGLRGVAYVLIASSSVALAVFIAMLIHPRTRRETQAGWFERTGELDPLPSQGDLRGQRPK
jgi:O-antigen/teichoic acid export membrane protein